MKIHVKSSSRLRCPFCHDAIEVEEARVCPTCSSAQHPACHEAHGGCAVCVGYSSKGRRRAPRRRQGSTSRAEQLLKSALAHGGWAIGLMFACFVGLFATGVLVTTTDAVPWALIPVLGSLLAAAGSFFFFLWALVDLFRAGLDALTRL